MSWDREFRTSDLDSEHSIRVVPGGSTPLDDPLIAALYAAHPERAEDWFVAQVTPKPEPEPEPEPEPTTPRHSLNLTKITCRMIADEVEQYYGLPPRALNSPSRKNDIVNFRMAYYWLVSTLTHASYPQMATPVGRKDHTTAMYGVKAAHRRYAIHDRFRDDCDVIRLRLLDRVGKAGQCR